MEEKPSVEEITDYVNERLSGCWVPLSHSKECVREVLRSYDPWKKEGTEKAYEEFYRFLTSNHIEFESPEDVFLSSMHKELEEKFSKQGADWEKMAIRYMDYAQDNMAFSTKNQYFIPLPNRHVLTRRLRMKY